MDTKGSRDCAVCACVWCVWCVCRVCVRGWGRVWDTFVTAGLPWGEAG